MYVAVAQEPILSALNQFPHRSMLANVFRLSLIISHTHGRSLIVRAVASGTTFVAIAVLVIGSLDIPLALDSPQKHEHAAAFEDADQISSFGVQGCEADQLLVVLECDRVALEDDGLHATQKLLGNQVALALFQQLVRVQTPPSAYCSNSQR